MLCPSITKTGIKIPSKIWSQEVYVNHYDTSYEHIRSQVERSLSLLKTTYLDVVLIHRLDYLLDADEASTICLRWCHSSM
jgi:predicted oxidoreductase